MGLTGLCLHLKVLQDPLPSIPAPARSLKRVRCFLCVWRLQAVCCLVLLQLIPAIQAEWLRLAANLVVAAVTVQLVLKLLIMVKPEQWLSLPSFQFRAAGSSWALLSFTGCATGNDGSSSAGTAGSCSALLCSARPRPAPPCSALHGKR
jgi:hypothetical protein